MIPEMREFLSTRMFLRWYMIVSSVLLAGLAAIVVILLVQYASVLGTQRAASISQCQQNNVNRQQDIAIWNRLLSVPPPHTAAQQAEINELEHLVAVKDTPRNCAAAFRK